MLAVNLQLLLQHRFTGEDRIRSSPATPHGLCIFIGKFPRSGESLGVLSGNNRILLMWNVRATFLVRLLFSALALHAQNSLPQLWPTFPEPTNIVNVNIAGQAGDDLMAITSFQGAFNQQQLSTRLYVSGGSAGADAHYWLTHVTPSGVTVTNLSFDTGDPDGALKALLGTYGPQGTNTVTKYVFCDPQYAPETCNMATTLAGINDAMVANPDNSTVIRSYGLTQVADLSTYSKPSGSQTIWIGNNSTLVNSTTYNRVNNPSGRGGTTGWSSNAGTVSTGAGTGLCSGQGTTLKWTRSGSGMDFAYTKPGSMRLNSTPYMFSVQVCVQSGAPVYLDAWDGTQDLKSDTVSTNDGWKTLQLAVPIPLTTPGSRNTTIDLQVRTNGGSTTVFFHNAAVIDSRTVVDMYQYNNLLSQTTGNILAQDFPDLSNLRDYLIAGKVFTFELTSNNADEAPLYNTILTDSHTAHNTPILGYIDAENQDVTYLSGSGRGHFLTASDKYNNGSVWASFPELSSLSQPAPAAVSPANGTVYVAFAPSDGDNLSIDEHTTQNRWSNGKYFGAVPMGWTTSPGMMTFAPNLLSYYYRFLPQSQEMIAGPSGVGYTRALTGMDLSPFASLTTQFLKAASMSTLDSSEDAQNYNVSLAQALNLNSYYNVPHIYASFYIPPTPEGPAHPQTMLDGQGVGYNKIPNDEVTSVKKWVSRHYAGSGAPTYLEALEDNLTYSTADVLYIAQQLQLTGGHPYVFLTPSELALTERAAGSQPTNAQAVAGSTLIAAYPQNLLYNVDGQEPELVMTSSGWAMGTSGHNESLVGTIYQGTGCQKLRVPENSSNAYIYAYQNLGNVPQIGRYYRFTATVAGSGTAQMTVWDGSANQHSAKVTLTSAWQTITMMVYMNSATSGQIQVGLVGSSSGQTMYFNATARTNPGWYYSQPGSATSFASLGGATFNNGYFNDEAFFFSVPGGLTNPQCVAQFPQDTSSFAANTHYTASVDVASGAAGGQAYLDVWNGTSDSTSSTVTLGSQWQTLKTTFTTGSSESGSQFEIRVPSGIGANKTVYFRNASLVPTNSIPTYGLQTGLEAADTQLSWTNTVDTVSPGGKESNVTSALTQFSSTITRGGGNAIQFGGTASGGTSTHAYLAAFSNGTTLTSNSKLTYWIYPMSPMGTEAGANSMTWLDSTCVAIDMVFTDATDLRDSGVKDQYGNLLHPAHQCNHLQPDQWNYVTADLSSLSGKTVNRIDIGYDQPGASGNYGGYVDDIALSY